MDEMQLGFDWVAARRQHAAQASIDSDQLNSFQITPCLLHLLPSFLPINPSTSVLSSTHTLLNHNNSYLLDEEADENMVWNAGEDGVKQNHFPR